MSKELDQAKKGGQNPFGLGLPESVNSHQKFSAFMREFIGRVGAKTIVEVGPDVMLKRAALIAPASERYYAVALPEDAERMQGWYKLLGFRNVEMVAGNAVSLSEFIPHADIVIIHNVLLDLTGNDVAQMWKYRRGEEKHTDEDWNRLVSNFDKARIKSYREFLKVTKPGGHVITFHRKEQAEEERAFITETLGLPSDRVRQQELLYDELSLDEPSDLWVAHIIDSV